MSWPAAWRCSAVPVDPARAGGSGRGRAPSRRARGRPARARQRPPRHAAWRRRENVCRGRRLSRSVWPSHVFTAHVLPRRPRPRAVIVHHVFTHRVGALPGPTERQVAVTALCVCEQFHAPSLIAHRSDCCFSLAHLVIFSASNMLSGATTACAAPTHIIYMQSAPLPDSVGHFNAVYAPSARWLYELGPVTAAEAVVGCRGAAAGLCSCDACL